MGVKNILIIGSDSKYEEKHIIKEGKTNNIEISQVFLSKIEILTEKETKIIYQKSDITKMLKNSIVIFRRTRKNYSSALSMVSFLLQNQIPFTDSFESIVTNLDKSLHLPFIQSKLIPQPKSVFLSKRNSSLINDLKLPLIVKPSKGRHGKGVLLIKNLNELNTIFKKTNKNLIIQEKIDLKKEYRIFILANKILGIVEKLPPKGSIVANYAAGSTFLKCDLPLNVRNEALKITKQLGIDIAGFDIAEDKNGNFFTLEVNRCPEFKAFSEATSINVAKEIINHIKIKYNL
jgi:RimK family alpha-L-glutamate ligase